MRIPKTVALSLFLVPGLLVLNAQDRKLKPEEIVSNYLDSIGPADKRAAVKTRVTYGSTMITYLVGGSGSMEGRGNIASQGRAIRMAFNAQNSAGEQIAFDGSKISSKDLPNSPGNYTPLSRFVLDNASFFKDGLLLGPLSTASLLLDVAGRKAKLNSNGLKKVDGRQLYEVKYPGKSGIETFFYFDPETFRHVRSLFKLSKVGLGRGAGDIRYQIVEQFEDFKPVDGLTLPHTYQLEYSIEGRLLIQWKHKIEKISHNEALEAPVFTIQ